MNNLNEITNSLFGGSYFSQWLSEMPVSGSTTSGATNVTVNGGIASLYSDNTFAINETVTNGLNSFMAVAKDAHGRTSTYTSSVTIRTNNSSYAYDLNGNLLTDGNRSFVYDDENELIGVSVANNWSNSFAYDGLDRRRIELDYSWNGSSWAKTNETHFIYDGSLVLQERDGNNLPMVTYTRGNDLSGSLQGSGGIGGLLARSDNELTIPAILYPASPQPQNAITTYYHTDGRGNVTTLMEPSGLLVANYEYDPFGNLVSQCGLLAGINKYRFSSKEWDNNSGLYYYGFRFYDPNLQRWPNRDPLGDFGGLVYLLPLLDQSANVINSQSADQFSLDDYIRVKVDVNVNLFGAMGNNPQEFVDPFGESIVGKVCVLGAKGLAKVLGKVGKKEAVDALKQGDDVIFKSRKEAQEAAKAAGGGKQPIHEIDKKTGNGHYHSADRSGGHAIYENTKFFAGALTFDYYAKDAKAGPLVQKAAEGLDLINPLSLGQDAFDVYDAFSGDSCQ